MCFARKVCRFDSSPLQRQKYASIISVRILLICSNGVDCSLYRGSLVVSCASRGRDRKTIYEAKNTLLTQSLAGLPERSAARRAFGIQKQKKCRQNLRDSSWQGYASDLGHVANLSDNVRVASRDVRHLQQALQCWEALVLLGVIRISSIVLKGLMCGKPMRQSRHTYLTSHRRARDENARVFRTVTRCVGRAQCTCRGLWAFAHASGTFVRGRRVRRPS